MPTYLLKTTIPGETAPATRERLISAKNRAQAIAHAVKDTITVEEASVPEAMRLAATGVKLETAAAE